MGCAYGSSTYKKEKEKIDFQVFLIVGDTGFGPVTS